MVYRGVMSRTNIDIDDELIERVMRRYRLPSKRAAVELALRRLAGEPMSRDEALAMEGTGWSGDLDELRAPDDAVGSGDPAGGS
jgi:Arc/MetJ family transcription regulator